MQLQNDSSDAEDAVDLEPHARATVGTKSDDDADADDGAGELERGHSLRNERTRTPRALRRRLGGRPS